MEILDSYVAHKEANDCLITTALALIRITYNIYVVAYTESVLNKHFDNPIKTNCQSFHNYYDSEKHYKKLYMNIQGNCVG